MYFVSKNQNKKNKIKRENNYEVLFIINLKGNVIFYKDKKLN